MKLNFYDLTREIYDYKKGDFLIKKKSRACPVTVCTGQILLADGLSYTRRRKHEVQILTC